MIKYFPKPYNYFGGNDKVKLDLSSYETKSDLEKVTGVDASKLAAKSDLASLKAEVNKIDIDKLMAVPIDLSKLRNPAKNKVVKKAVYDKLVTKVNNIDTSGFVLIEKRKSLILVDLLC